MYALGNSPKSTCSNGTGVAGTWGYESDIKDRQRRMCAFKPSAYHPELSTCQKLGNTAFCVECFLQGFGEDLGKSYPVNHLLALVKHQGNLVGVSDHLNRSL